MLARWNNNPRIDMLPHPDTLSWFWGNQSLLFLLNATCLAEKQQIPIWWSLGWPDRDSNSRSTALEANTVIYRRNCFFTYITEFILKINSYNHCRSLYKSILTTSPFQHLMDNQHCYIMLCCLFERCPGITSYIYIFIYIQGLVEYATCIYIYLVLNNRKVHIFQSDEDVWKSEPSRSGGIVPFNILIKPQFCSGIQHD